MPRSATTARSWPHSRCISAHHTASRSPSIICWLLGDAADARRWSCQLLTTAIGKITNGQRRPGNILLRTYGEDLRGRGCRGRRG